MRIEQDSTSWFNCCVLACEYPNEAVVDLLLRSRAQVNCSCSLGGTALHEASRHGQLNLCRMLLEAGANLQTRNIFGIQPLFVAAQHGHVNMIQLLAYSGEYYKPVTIKNLSLKEAAFISRSHINVCCNLSLYLMFNMKFYSLGEFLQIWHKHPLKDELWLSRDKVTVTSHLTYSYQHNVSQMPLGNLAQMSTWIHDELIRKRVCTNAHKLQLDLLVETTVRDYF